MTRQLAFVLFLLLAPGPLAAHHVELTVVDVTFFADHSYQVDLTHDVDSWLADRIEGEVNMKDPDWFRVIPPEVFTARLGEVRDYFTRYVRVRFDDVIDRPAVVFPALGEGQRGRIPPAPLPGNIVRLEGRLPDQADSFVFNASRRFGRVVLTIVREAGGEETRQLLSMGERSQPYSLKRSAAEGGSLGVLGTYTLLGFEHILPKGLDHILFIVALYLLSVRLGPLLWQVTAFTLAHSVTLALAIYGLVTLPNSVVEPIIALSITLVALENVFTTELKPWRPVVVFIFGLIHGLGFAGVLIELGFPRQEMLSGLVGFNVGVELGQLAVVGLAFALTGWFRERDWYRRRVVVPASLLIAAVGLYWTFERIL